MIVVVVVVVKVVVIVQVLVIRGAQRGGRRCTGQRTRVHLRWGGALPFVRLFQ